MFKKFLLLMTLLIPLIMHGCCGPADFCLPCTPTSFKLGDGSMNPVALTFSPNGSCLVTANFDTNDITVFSVDPVTCDLDVIDTLSTGTSPANPVALGYTVDGACLAVVDQTIFPSPTPHGAVSIFQTSNVGCFLNPTPTIIQDNNVVANPMTLAISPNCLFISNRQIVDCLHLPPPPPPYRLGTTQLTNTGDCTFMTTLFETSIVGSLSVIDIKFSSDFSCAFLLIQGDQLPPEPGNFVIASFPFNSKACFDIAALLQLKQFPPTPPFIPCTSNPIKMAVSSNDCLALLNQGDNTISMFTVDPIDCSLTPVPGSPFKNGPGTANPVAFAFSKDGKCLFVVNQDSNNLSIFNVDPDTCALQLRCCPISLAPRDKGPTDIVFAPNGKCFAVSNGQSNTVTIFRLNLAPVINCVTVNPDGTVTIMGSASPGDTISVFSGSELIGSESLSPSGPGTFNILTSALPCGQQTLLVVACNANCSGQGTSITVCIPKH